MFNPLALLLVGVLLPGQVVATADRIQIGQDSGATQLEGHVVVTFAPEASVEVTARNVSFHYATGEARLKGDARVAVDGVAMVADQLVLRRRAPGGIEIVAERLRISGSPRR